MSHMSLSESYKSHCLGLLSKYQEKEEEELASTRPVGFAAGKNLCRSFTSCHIQGCQKNVLARLR